MSQSILSFASDNGGLLVAIGSGVVAVVLAFIPGPRLRWLLVAVVPLLIAVSVYWMPVWRGADSSEYSAWWPAVVLPWYAVSLLVAVGVCLGVGRLRRGAR